MDDVYCGGAEEAFEQFGDVLGTVIEAFEDVSIANNRYIRTLAQLYSVDSLYWGEDAQSDAEEERCLRRAVRCYVTDSVLEGSAASWTTRQDVAKVISHRDGRYTIFARMYPRLSRWEVLRLKADICTFLPPDAQVRIIATWSLKRR